TYTRDLASAILDLAQRRAVGIYHVVNSGACSWYEFALEIARCMKSKVPIEPVSSDAFRRPAARPRNSVLSCRKFERLTGKRLRPWSEALADYIGSFPAPSAPG
ncbi:MAG: sugar nucleotide-binding protein, partial [Planctomycetes bacterium]|nr:sugar nucleotide-binding protein [Planctomycetota bacterium]